MNCNDEQSMVQEQARITSLTELSPGYFHLSLHAPEIANAARPGQFAQLRPAARGTIDPLLARPISIVSASPKDKSVSFIFKVVGRGTALLAEKQPGDSITVLGPIGTGFSIPDSVQSLALIGGGVGMPPLYFLAERLRETRPDLKISLFYGGRSQGDLLMLPDWEKLNVPVFAATDDGSYGHHGLVTEPLQAEVDRQGFDFVAACGPKPMLRAVHRLATAAGIPGQLSFEERMACGVGACLGCVCATLSGNRRVCVDGPVFALNEVSFDA
ncbi:MAG: dihydroorotate dehydrogenase electron transfer subunit [Armatimonadota bacterium]